MSAKKTEQGAKVSPRGTSGGQIDWGGWVEKPQQNKHNTKQVQRKLT